MHTLKELIKDHLVVFEYYRDHELWYRVLGTDFLFPVPIQDAEGATFPAQEKALFFMKWIKSYMEEIQKSPA